MSGALRLIPAFLALLIGSSAGPEEALRFVPTVALERSVVRLGDKRFVLTTWTRTFPFVFDPGVASAGHVQTTSSETIRLAQIEGAATPSDRRWNAIARARLKAMLREAYVGVNHSGHAVATRQTQVELGIEPAAVAPGIIAAQLSWYVYPLDLMKGWGANRAFLWSEREQRALTAEDLFDPRTRWWKALVPTLLEAAYEQPVPEGVEGYETLERGQVPMIGSQGMWLKFHEGDSSAFVLDQPTFVRWEALRPSLRNDLPFDRRRLAERGTASAYEG